MSEIYEKSMPGKVYSELKAEKEKIIEDKTKEIITKEKFENYNSSFNLSFKKNNNNLYEKANVTLKNNLSFSIYYLGD